jgi:hypothetical protein
MVKAGIRSKVGDVPRLRGAIRRASADRGGKPAPPPACLPVRSRGGPHPHAGGLRLRHRFRTSESPRSESARRTAPRTRGTRVQGRRAPLRLKDPNWVVNRPLCMGLSAGGWADSSAARLRVTRGRSTKSDADGGETAWGWGPPRAGRQTLSRERRFFRVIEPEGSTGIRPAAGGVTRWRLRQQRRP